jgi:hypothetical protein
MAGTNAENGLAIGHLSRIDIAAKMRGMWGQKDPANV